MKAIITCDKCESYLTLPSRVLRRTNTQMQLEKHWHIPPYNSQTAKEKSQRVAAIQSKPRPPNLPSKRHFSLRTRLLVNRSLQGPDTWHSRGRTQGTLLNSCHPSHKPQTVSLADAAEDLTRMPHRKIGDTARKRACQTLNIPHIYHLLPLHFSGSIISSFAFNWPFTRVPCEQALSAQFGERLDIRVLSLSLRVSR